MGQYAGCAIGAAGFHLPTARLLAPIAGELALDRVVLGSVAEAIVRWGAVPVLLVRDGMRSTAGPPAERPDGGLACGTGDPDEREFARDGRE